uniref:Uncharacterized protein n=1 Tax=Strongyloides venezuelensis TaxID=75913 RepID=A0A0K0G604_STRVS
MSSSSWKERKFLSKSLSKKSNNFTKGLMERLKIDESKKKEDHRKRAKQAYLEEKRKTNKKRRERKKEMKKHSKKHYNNNKKNIINMNISGKLQIMKLIYSLIFNN